MRTTALLLFNLFTPQSFCVVISLKSKGEGIYYAISTSWVLEVSLISESAAVN